MLLRGRNRAKDEVTRAAIAQATGNDNLGLYVADFVSLAQVRRLAEEVQANEKRLDVLINNAGVFQRRRELTEDGFEETFAVNCLVPFLLTNLLLGLLERSAPARVVTVSSGMHYSARLDWGNLQGERDYDVFAAYSLSKLGDVLFTLEPVERLAASRVTANAMEPGVNRTNLLRAGWGGGGSTDARVGGRRLAHVARTPELAGVSGKYFARDLPVSPSPLAEDPAVRKRFWDLCARLTGLL